MDGGGDGRCGAEAVYYEVAVGLVGKGVGGKGEKKYYLCLQVAVKYAIIYVDSRWANCTLRSRPSGKTAGKAPRKVEL